MPDDPSSAQPRRRRKLSAILKADVSGFSRMMSTNEEATVGVIQEFHARLRALIEQFEGRVIDTAGDSVLAEFDSVVNAVGCARRIQSAEADANEARGTDEKVETRIGVHIGDVIVEDYRVYGDGVNIAARLEPLADPGGICISEAVYHQVRGKLDLPVEDLGLRELKNIEHPIRLYKIAPLRPTAAAAPGAPIGAHVPPSPRERPLRDDLRRTSTLVLTVVGAFLLASPLVLFPTAGVFPTAGAVLLGTTLGRVWARRSRHPGNFLIALGAGIASGAIWTDWSQVTNALFVLGGVIVAAVGSGVARGKSRDLDFPGA
ncbi:MAG: adenylate/guanylate cyclase domain-containing protein [Candidatus Binatia bacterium]